jgi:hypothetical protein
MNRRRFVLTSPVDHGGSPRDAGTLTAPTVWLIAGAGVSEMLRGKMAAAIPNPPPGGEARIA